MAPLLHKEALSSLTKLMKPIITPINLTSTEDSSKHRSSAVVMVYWEYCVCEKQSEQSNEVCQKASVETRWKAPSSLSGDCEE